LKAGAGFLPVISAKVSSPMSPRKRLDSIYPMSGKFLYPFLAGNAES
jgi:hypothetical protein